MNRRQFLKSLSVSAIAGTMTENLFAEPPSSPSGSGEPWIDPAKADDWRQRWEKSILGDAHSRYCDKEMGEEIGWLISPFLNGFYYGWLATRDPKWVEILVDWTDSWVRRGVKGPDGYLGWPKGNGGGGESKEFSADSLLGEAMALRPVVLMARQIKQTPELNKKWSAQAEAYQELAAQIFEKWDSRSCWRETPNGGLWVVPDFGTDLITGKWSAGHEHRLTGGFSNPDNKENHIALWMLAMHDVTGKAVYRERAEKWFRLMRSRLRTREEGKYFVWNYWEPAGPWDYKPDGSPKHWVGVHPNGGYYEIDVSGMVAAFEHGLVFSRDDINRLIATNRDFMWNRQVQGAKFQRIDGGEVDERWKNSPGVLWSSLVPYDARLKKIFLENHNPSGWGGISGTPWFLSLGRA